MSSPRSGAAPSDRELLRRWVIVVTAGELAGFTLPATVGIVTSDQPAAVSYPALVAAGLLEGAVLGWAQWSVARRRLPALSRRRWVALTSIGAATAYAIALLAPMFWERLNEWAIGLQVAVFVTGGMLLLLTIGTAQWIELRHHVPRASRWIATTALAWAVALIVFVAIATPLWYEGQAFWATLAVGIGAGLVMALAMAAVTGLALVRLSRIADRRADRPD